MADRRVRKIRRQALDLCLSGVDVLFVAESPNDPIGKGATFLFGTEDTPTQLLCARRTLNELKHQLSKIGLEFTYTLSQMEETR